MFFIFVMNKHDCCDKNINENNALKEQKMKVINTKKGRFQRFVKKNGAYFVLGLVIVAACIAVYVGTGKKINGLSSYNDSNISNGDDNNWSSKPQNVTTQTNTQQHRQQLTQSRHFLRF